MELQRKTGLHLFTSECFYWFQRNGLILPFFLWWSTSWTKRREFLLYSPGQLWKVSALSGCNRGLHSPSRSWHASLRIPSGNIHPASTWHTYSARFQNKIKLTTTKKGIITQEKKKKGCFANWLTQPWGFHFRVHIGQSADEVKEHFNWKFLLSITTTRKFQTGTGHLSS